MVKEIVSNRQIEVPLKSYTDNIGKEILVENGEYGKDHQQELTRRLIIARHDTCQTDMFIITIVPSMDYGGDVVKSVEDFRYLGGGDFTGYVFCSTLEGEFVKAFGYTNGRCNGQVYAIPASRAAELKKERPELFVNSKVFRFQELPRLSQKTYTKSSDWGDDDWCDHGFPPGGCAICASGSGSSSGGNTGGSGSSNRCEHGLSPGSCSICNGGGITRCQHGNNIETCSLCNSTVDGGDLDEVVVVVCPGCGTRDGCTCQICPGCLQKMYKCKCTYCIRCEKPMSLCDCFIYPDPDPDPDPTPGGGGSGGGVTPGTDDGNDGGTVILPDVELMNKDNFVGYDISKDCMVGCRAIMENYGVAPGSSNNVYQLLIEKDGDLVYYDVENYQTIYDNAIACINRHLDADRPIIVGVNHSPNKGDNEGATDHWVVITGREYDSEQQQYYYTYMDTGRYQASSAAACDSKKNRLYYDAINYTFIDEANYNSQQLDVTQVRPNDGKNLDETIAQPVFKKDESEK